VTAACWLQASVLIQQLRRLPAVGTRHTLRQVVCAVGSPCASSSCRNKFACMHPHTCCLLLLVVLVLLLLLALRRHYPLWTALRCLGLPVCAHLCALAAAR
jgi:hypothetical protein